MSSSSKLRSRASISLIIAISVQSAFASSLASRAAQPQVYAICSSNFSWMNNAKGQSPCVVAAWVEESCASTSWTIPALSPGNHYNAPNSTTSTNNPCSCSWSAYNLLQGCTACQGVASIITWGSWQLDCSGFLSATTYFPSDRNFTLPTETSIPYWAGTNPQTWNDGIFDVTQAQTIEQQGHADLTGVPISTSSKKKPVGAIVGGVIGGLALILIAGALITWGIVKKRRSLGQNQSQNPPSGSDYRPGHIPSMSDFSQKYINSNANGSHAMMPQPMQQFFPVVNPGATNVVPLSSPSVDQFGVQNNMAISPQVMSPVMYPVPQPTALSQLPTVGDTPAGGIVTRASQTNSQHIQQLSVSSVGSAMASISPAHGQQRSLDEIITPFRSIPTSPRPARNDNGRETPPSTIDYSDVSSITPASQLGRRRNPPAYTAEPRAGELLAAVSPPEDDRVKYEYEPSTDTSRREPEPNIHEELEYIDVIGTSTGVGSGGATQGSALELVPSRRD